jgi:hypothetical protein
MRRGSRRRTDALLVLVVTSVVASAFATGGAAGAEAPEPGDSKLFDTWTGYETGRFLEAVVSADLNGDGKPDAAWARNDFFDNRMMVQLNLGDGTLGPSVGYPARSQSNDIAAGDLDGDLDLDLVVVSQGDDFRNSLVDVYRNNGAGAFARTTTAGGTGAKRVVLADFDGDDDLDVALTNYWGTSNDVSVLLNNGNATFAPERRFVVGAAPHGVAALNLDGDADVDLAVARFDQDLGTTHVALLRNNGAGVFTLASTITLGADRIGDPSIAGEDLDGDGDTDLAVAGVGTDRLVILRRTGNFAFAQHVEVSQFTAFDLLAHDVDVDGDVDLVQPSFESDSGELAYLKNNGDATFAAPIRIDAGRNPHGLDAADYDGNGRPDLAVANRVTDTGGIHPQRQDGSFASPPIYQTPATLPLSVVPGDFDRDGDLDIALGSADKVEILRNAGDGSLALAGSIQSCTICLPGTTTDVRDLWSADLNGDGALDLLWAPDSPPYPYVFTLNNGNGTFGPIHETPIDTCGTGAATSADLDDDGDQDIMVANNRSGPSAFCESIDDHIRVALNLGNANFADDYGVTVQSLPQKALGADVDEDGRTDIVSTSTFVSVVDGLGGGAFGPPELYNARGSDLRVLDLDADGDLDVATADRSMWSSWVLQNDGTGRLTQLTKYPSEVIPGYANNFALDVADVDDDGLLDLVIANPSGNNVALHFGVGPGRFETEQLRYGAHKCFLDVEAVDMDKDGLLDLVGPGCSGFGFGPPKGVTVLLNQGEDEPGRCTIEGTDGPDVLRGTAGDDVICGFGGNDTITGRGGDDELLGGPGGDSLNGGPGSDDHFGEGGADKLDSRDGVGGNDLLDGGPGRDRCRADGGDTKIGCP